VWSFCAERPRHLARSVGADDIEFTRIKQYLLAYRPDNHDAFASGRLLAVCWRRHIHSRL
jgi:hypothetical protein